jgi:hypothetical protein
MSRIWRVLRRRSAGHHGRAVVARCRMVSRRFHLGETPRRAGGEPSAYRPLLRSTRNGPSEAEREAVSHRVASPVRAPVVGNQLPGRGRHKHIRAAQRLSRPTWGPLPGVTTEAPSGFVNSQRRSGSFTHRSPRHPCRDRRRRNGSGEEQPGSGSPAGEQCARTAPPVSTGRQGPAVAPAFAAHWPPGVNACGPRRCPPPAYGHLNGSQPSHRLGRCSGTGGRTPR